MAQILKKIVFSMIVCLIVMGLIECLLGCTGIADRIYRDRQSLSPVIMRDPILSWDLKPNLNIIYGDVAVSTGERGFRGGDPPPPGKYSEILCLGDSVTFGWNVSENETFPSQLAACLESREPDRWNVINAGVPGHSSHQGRLRLESLLRDIKPVKVLLCYGINDRFPTAATDLVCLPGKPQLIRLLQRSGIATFLAAFQPPGTRIRMEPEKKQDHVTTRVPGEQFERNIDWMIATCRKHNADVLLVSEYVNNLDTLKDVYH
jgi:lysophospholipase L1-like esterase